MFEDEIARIADDRLTLPADRGDRPAHCLGALSRDTRHRVFDSGIAEQHLLASAAGLAAVGNPIPLSRYLDASGTAPDQLLCSTSGCTGYP